MNLSTSSKEEIKKYYDTKLRLHREEMKKILADLEWHKATVSDLRTTIAERDRDHLQKVDVIAQAHIDRLERIHAERAKEREVGNAQIQDRDKVIERVTDELQEAQERIAELEYKLMTKDRHLEVVLDLVSDTRP